MEKLIFSGLTYKEKALVETAKSGMLVGGGRGGGEREKGEAG